MGRRGPAVGRVDRQLPMVGRSDDIQHLVGILVAADDRTPQVVAVHGRPGIGKSRLLEAFADEARRRGAHVLAGRAESFERGVPYGAVTDALVRYERPGDPSVGKMVDAALEAFVASEGDHDERLTLAVSRWWQLIRALSRTAAVVVVLDDFHAADDDTVALMLALARRSHGQSVVIVVAVRHPLPVSSSAIEHFTTSAATDATLSEISLEPLRSAEVGELLTSIVGSPPAAATVNEVVSRADGNPFLVIEITKALVASGMVELDDAGAFSVDASRPWPSPAATLLARLLPLDVDVHGVAKVLSAMGRVALVHLPVVATASGLERSDVVRTFDKLVRAGLLRAEPTGEYVFTHELLREAIYDDLGPAECADLHLLLANALEDLRAGGQPVDVVDIARHAVAGSQGADPIAATRAARAGDQAARTAPASAAQWYASAVGLSPADLAERASWQARQAQALARCGRLRDALAVSQTALEELRSGNERLQTIGVLVQALLARGDAARAIELLDRERRVFGPSATLLSWQSSALVVLERLDEAASVIERIRASRGVRADDDPLLLAHEIQLADARGDTDRASALLERLARLRTAPTEPGHLFALGWAAHVAVSSRMVRDAVAVLAPARRVAIERPELTGASLVEVASALISWATGAWDEALDVIEVASPKLDTMGQLMYVAHLATAEVNIRVARGELDLAAGITAPVDHLPPRFAAMWAEGQARLLAELDRPLDALAVVDDTLGALTPPAVVAVLGLTTTAVIAHRAGDHADAERRLASADHWALRSSPLAQLLLALAAAEIAGDREAAVEGIRLAEDQPFELAQARFHAGRLGVDSAGNLPEALRAFQELGAPTWQRRTRAALRELGLPVPRSARRPPGTLTDAEAQVAMLVAAGLRNREIAAELAYSVRTVETYLSRIYDKVGVRTRVALARLVQESTD